MEMTREVEGGVFFFFFRAASKGDTARPTPIASWPASLHGREAHTRMSQSSTPRHRSHHGRLDRQPPGRAGQAPATIDRALGWATPGASRRAPAVRRPDEEDTMERVKDKECEAREKAMVSGDVEGSV